VPEPALSPPAARSAFLGLLSPGRRGRPDGLPGVRVFERTGVAVVSLAARRGAGSALVAALAGPLGLALPGEPLRVEGAGCAALWAGPGQWMLLAQGGRASTLESDVASAAAGLGSVAAVGDGRGILVVSGPRARDALAKGIALDLDPRVFPAGRTALTMASMIDVQVTALDDSPRYELMLFRGFAGSFWHWLEASALEYGLEITNPA
jgi:heterotetrameric sarcosine oxidase gamma subunit